MRVTVTFEDGQTEAINIKPLRMSDAEEYMRQTLKKDPAQSLMMVGLVGAWIVKGRPGDFREWAETVDEMNVEDPTQARPVTSDPPPVESLASP